MRTLVPQYAFWHTLQRASPPCQRPKAILLHEGRYKGFSDMQRAVFSRGPLTLSIDGFHDRARGRQGSASSGDRLRSKRAREGTDARRAHLSSLSARTFCTEGGSRIIGPYEPEHKPEPVLEYPDSLKAIGTRIHRGSHRLRWPIFDLYSTFRCAVRMVR